MSDEFGPSLPPVEGGEWSDKQRGQFRPSVSMPMEEAVLIEPEPGAKEDMPELQKAFNVIEAHLAKKHPFSNRQADIGARLIMSKLRDEQVSKIKEVASTQRRPIWQCFGGWFNFADGNAMLYSPTFESNWNTEVETEADMVRCKNCDKGFVPPRFGVAVCSPGCGAALAKKLIAERLAKQDRPNLEA